MESDYWNDVLIDKIIYYSFTGMWISYLIQKKNRGYTMRYKKTYRLFETTDDVFIIKLFSISKN